MDWEEVVYVFRSPEPEGTVLNAMSMARHFHPYSVICQGALGMGRGGVPSVSVTRWSPPGWFAVAIYSGTDSLSETHALSLGHSNTRNRHGSPTMSTRFEAKFILAICTWPWQFCVRFETACDGA